MFCENCSLSNSSDADCKLVNTLLKMRRIFKITLFDKETSLIEANHKRCFYKILDSDCNHLSYEDDESYEEWLDYELNYMLEEVVDDDWYLNSNAKWMRFVGWVKRDRFNMKLMKLVKIIETKLTVRQYAIIWWDFDGTQMSEIGRRLGISGQAVKYAIFGHPKYGGGIAKKVRKELECSNILLKNYDDLSDDW